MISYTGINPNIYILYRLNKSSFPFPGGEGVVGKVEVFAADHDANTVKPHKSIFWHRHYVLVEILLVLLELVVSVPLGK